MKYHTLKHLLNVANTARHFYLTFYKGRLRFTRLARAADGTVYSTNDHMHNGDECYEWGY